jgi:hypothetical protein
LCPWRWRGDCGVVYDVAIAVPLPTHPHASLSYADLVKDAEAKRLQDKLAAMVHAKATKAAEVEEDKEEAAKAEAAKKAAAAAKAVREQRLEKAARQAREKQRHVARAAEQLEAHPKGLNAGYSTDTTVVAVLKILVPTVMEAQNIMAEVGAEERQQW